MGMVNQLGKFSPSLAEISQPLRELLSSKRKWVRSSDQEATFQMVKKELTQPAVIALYDLRANTRVSADPSSYGLGFVLLRECKDTWKPVAYASCSMSASECGYAHNVSWVINLKSRRIIASGPSFECKTLG